MRKQLHQLFLDSGLGEELANTGVQTAKFLMLPLAAYIAYRIAKGPILRTIATVIRRGGADWNEILLEQRTFYRLALLVPGVVVYRMAPVTLTNELLQITRTGAQIYLILTGMFVIDAILSTTIEIFRRTDMSREISIKGLVQFLKVILFFLCGIFVLSVLLGKSPLYLLSGLTALTAVLLLIFRDAILGLVAGIQLSVDRMVARGDWVEMPKYGADGDVVDVTLTTVKVQNWDMTITTIPTYALISESFKNWRGMQNSGGRRIKRSVFIDIGTVKFCNEEMIKRFGQIQYITDHIDRKKQELSVYNELNHIDLSHLVNGRRMTNIGTFRAYVEAYLRNHPKINQEMTFLVRQLAPTAKGLAIEIYVFCTDQVWSNYEAIQSDIFDHILAIVPEFDLRIFQDPAGGDFRSLNPRQPLS
tara:strand:- start:222 stop:1475 length:1254 start_codon:yes stop_codon:yes gene_type:complete